MHIQPDVTVLICWQGKNCLKINCSFADNVSSNIIIVPSFICTSLGQETDVTDINTVYQVHSFSLESTRRNTFDLDCFRGIHGLR